MPGQLLLGVDIGTQGVKCLLFSKEGDCLSSSFVSSRLYQPEAGITEEDPDFQVESVCQAISNCINSAGNIDRKKIVALAIDGQMAGITGIGVDGKAVTPYDSWLDTRCAPYIKIMKDSAEKLVIEKTGNPPGFTHGSKILWWKHERPDVYDRIAKFVQPGAYAAMQLCGRDVADAFIDHTYLHFSGFADNMNQCWHEELISIFDIDADKLPEITSSEQIIGETTTEMTKKCGLLHPIPVAAGCGDTAASFLSCGAVHPGISIDVAGTASVFAATTDAFICDTENQIMGCGASATPGLWHPYAYINGGGLNLEWFVCEILGVEKTDSQRFESLIPDNYLPKSTDPFFIPHMAGRGHPIQPNMRGGFAGLSWSHTRKDMFMAIIESIALEYGIYRNALLNMHPEFSLKEMRITGGGEKDLTWKNIKSAVLQSPVVSIEKNYGAPMGSAIIAGYAVGIFDTIVQAANSWIKLKDLVHADHSQYSYYQERVKKYSQLLSAMNEYYNG